MRALSSATLLPQVPHSQNAIRHKEVGPVAASCLHRGAHVRLRCARCGCYAKHTGGSWAGNEPVEHVQPCKRCLEEVRRQARPVSLLVRALRGV